MLNTSQGKVLYIDDDPLNLRLVNRSLKHMGYEVFEAMEANNGINLAHQVQPDVILLDLHMPGMNGFEATLAIKADERLRHIPVVILTADMREDTRRESLECGVDAHLNKPISRSLLLKVVGQMMKSQEEELAVAVH